MKQKIVLHFPSAVVEQPFIYYLVKDFNLVVNILKAEINPRKEGRIVLEVSGDDQRYDEALEFLQANGLRVSSLRQEIIWNEERCTHCGACSVICPSGALVLQRPEMLICFDEQKCVACEHCLKACPARAMEARF